MTESLVPLDAITERSAKQKDIIDVKDLLGGLSGEVFITSTSFHIHFQDLAQRIMEGGILTQQVR